MRLFLKAQTEGEVKQPIWLSSGQSLTVGRSDEAQFAVSTDLLMSRIHFEISVVGEECLVLDRGSSNGTFLNKERIREARLKDADRIQAGQTLFVVQLEPTVVPQNAPKPAAPDEAVRPRIIKKECSSGVVQVQLKKRTPPPVSNPVSISPADNSTVAKAEDENITTMPGVAPSWSHSEQDIDGRRTMELFPDGLATPFEEFPRPDDEVTPATPDTVAILQVVSGSEIGRALRIDHGQSLSAGRLEGNDFSFPTEQAMSGRHFRIDFFAGELVVQDLGSRNGMFVNGIPCKRAALCDCDRLMVGDVVFQVRFDSQLRDPKSSRFAKTAMELA